MDSPLHIPHPVKSHPEFSVAEIIGSGMVSRAFSKVPVRGGNSAVKIYAAGVSNSQCSDRTEYGREEIRLRLEINKSSARQVFVYFSSCSVYEASAGHGFYQRHKLAMEEIVRKRSKHIIFRLPQLVGVTSNPHTLTNHLFLSMVRRERFQVWSGATRNLIDVDDAATIAADILSSGAEGETINIANPDTISIMSLVGIMEQTVGIKAMYDVVERGSGYHIDIERILPVIHRLDLGFGERYAGNLLAKYYGGRGEK